MTLTAKLVHLENTLAACYRVEQSRRGWLQGVVEAMRVDWGVGCSGFTYEIDKKRGLVVGEVVRGDAPSVELDDRELIKLACTAPHATAACSISNSRAVDGGAHDAWLVHGHNLDGHHVLIVVNGSPLCSPQPRVQQLLERIAVHVAAGARFQRRLELAHRPHQAADTIHALPARLKLTKGELRLGPNKAGVSTNWNIIHHFETNGQQYLVACEPSSPRGGPQALSSREREMLAFAARGHTNKEIAYELGVAPSTVRVLLARAMRKLGVRARQDAVRCFTHDAGKARLCL